MQFSITIISYMMLFVAATDPPTNDNDGRHSVINIQNNKSPSQEDEPGVNLNKRGANNDRCDGCYKGKCWTYCDNGVLPGSWCYGSSGKTFDGNVSYCNNDSDCTKVFGKCQRCAGACTP